MKTLKEKCQQFVLNQVLCSEIDDTFESVIKKIREGDQSICISDESMLDQLDPDCIADIIECKASDLIEFCKSLLTEKEDPAGNPVSGLKKCIDDLQKVCDELDGAVKEDLEKIEPHNNQQKYGVVS